MTISELRDRANTSEEYFQKIITLLGFSNEFEAYRAEEKGFTWPQELEDAYKQRIADLHAFFLARDGEEGVLGSRGL